MAEMRDKMLTVMNVTNRDRQTVVRTLFDCDWDMAAAVNTLMTDWQKKSQETGAQSSRGPTVIQEPPANRRVKPTGRFGIDHADEDTVDVGEYTEHLGEINKKQNTERRGESRGDKEYLTLKVVRPMEDHESVEIHFRVKHSTSLGKLKRSYSDKIGIHVVGLRFLYDGQRISDEATPGSLEMESGDYIEVYTEEGGVNWSPDEITGDILETSNAMRVEDLALDDSHEESSGTSKGPKIRRFSQDDIEAGPAVKRMKNTEGNALPQDTDPVRDELDKMTRKYEDLVRKLRDKVECPVCFDVPKRAPIPVCPNGHVVCRRCEREECPTCRVKMERGKSTLAVTVIENIDHHCEYEGCDGAYPLRDLPAHELVCDFRPVKCPGLDCNTKVSLASLASHVVSCCVERGEIKTYQLPHKFSYMMNEDVEDLVGERQNFNWKLEAMRFDERIFFLKVTRKARWGRWFFFVQMVGGRNLTAQYGVRIIVFRPEDGPEGKYSQTYCGDICPIDVTTVDEAEDMGICLTLKDGGMEKFFVRNVVSGENEFSVSVNLFKH